jgi:hypothetical protein
VVAPLPARSSKRFSLSGLLLSILVAALSQVLATQCSPLSNHHSPPKFFSAADQVYVSYYPQVYLKCGTCNKWLRWKE